MPKVCSSTVPTGGIVALQITPSSGVDQVSGTTVIQRYTGSLLSSAVTIYSGTTTAVFLDDGELLPDYLDFGTTYYYKVTDTGGTATTSGIVPKPAVIIFNSYIDKILFRAFSAGVNSLATIASGQGFGQIRVLEAMPLTASNESLPFIVMNLDLEQQEHIQIGEAVVNSGFTNNFAMPSLHYRRYSISILTKSSIERDFYKNACIGIYYSIIPTLSLIGSDVSIDFSVAQSQVSEAGQGMAPGFFEATLMIDLTGIFNTIVVTDYGLIEHINPNIIDKGTIIVG